MALVCGLLAAGAAVGVVLSYYLFARYEVRAFSRLHVPQCTGIGPPPGATGCSSGPEGFGSFLPAAFLGGIPLGLVAIMDAITGIRLWAVRFADALRQQRAVRLARILAGTMVPAIVFGGFFSLFGLAFLNIKKDDRLTTVAASVCALLILAAFVMQLILFVVTLMARARRAQ